MSEASISIGTQHDEVYAAPPKELTAYYQQYVADRERLFNTSRALTVNEMATTLAHELNQPIGTVVNLLAGCLSRLKRRDYVADIALCQHQAEDQELIQALDFAVRQAQFASQIIARVRDFTEARQPSMERLNLGDLVRESIALLDWVLAGEAVDVDWQLAEEELMVACDRMLLQQVIVNLSRNAIEAMRLNDKPPRRLTLETFQTEDGIHLSIVDTGPGLDDETFAALFTPFVSNKLGGMGVGLNICRSFVELHQGRLWVERNKVRGCTVQLCLPIARSNGLSR